MLHLQEGRTLKVWPIAQVAELQHARYLLQPRALELFLYDHSSALLSFETPKVSLCDVSLDDSLGLLLGTEAPVMTPGSVDFSFLVIACTAAVVHVVAIACYVMSRMHL